MNLTDNDYEPFDESEEYSLIEEREEEEEDSVNPDAERYTTVVTLDTISCTKFDKFKIQCIHVMYKVMSNYWYCLLMETYSLRWTAIFKSFPVTPYKVDISLRWALGLLTPEIKLVILPSFSLPCLREFGVISTQTLCLISLSILVIYHLNNVLNDCSEQCI